MAQNVKTVQGLASASVKTVAGLAMGSAKTIMGVDNTGGGGGGTEFVTGQTPGSTFSNFTGDIGFVFTIAGANIDVTELGRWAIAGNSATHDLFLCAADFSIIGTVSVDMAGAPAGAYKYATLASPVTLTAGLIYYLVSHETNGGDQWHSSNTTVTTTAVASIGNACYGTAGAGFSVEGGANHSFGPLNFKTSP